jgi:linoleoyl-CoA desaturase
LIQQTHHTSAARGGSTLPKLKFKGNDGFFRELNKRVDAYFETTGRRRRDCPQMYFKTATVLGWFLGVYVLLMFVVSSWWLVVPLAAVLGLAVAAIGFNIQHDGGHRSYSNYQWINRLMAMSIELIGGSSYIWDVKHNSIHHTYTNIHGHDDDIDVGILARLSPQQPRRWFHRYQGIYLWVLYGLLAVKWNFFDDFYNVARARIGEHKFARPRGNDLLVFVVGKLLFFSIAFVLPMLLHPVWGVIGVYLISSFVSGVVMSVIFQLAHVVKEADFPVPVEGIAGTQQIEMNWAVHQVQTTVDFARRNPVLCWLLGGLNFQVEHHLFHKICHVHYPALSKLVEQTSQEFGVRYNAHRSLWAGIMSHARHLIEMGRSQPAAG